MGQIDRFMTKHNIDNKYISMPFLSLYIAFILFLPGFFGITYDGLLSDYKSLSVDGKISLWGFISISLTFVNMLWTYFVLSSNEKLSAQNQPVQNQPTHDLSTQNFSTENSKQP